jgi:hypothetical protein
MKYLRKIWFLGVGWYMGEDEKALRLFKPALFENLDVNNCSF